MSDKKNKIYAGFFKEKQNQYGTYFQVDFSKKNLEDLLSKLDEKGYVKAMAFKLKPEKVKNGNTHSFTIFEPDPNYKKPEQNDGWETQEAPF